MTAPIKKFFKLSAALFLFLILFIVLANFWIVIRTNSKLYTSVQELPTNEVGLVLGTSRTLRNGESNPFFANRLSAAANLYHSRKIRKILVSGDNTTVYYNEPRDMVKGLLALNVPQEDIIMDYAGFRTLDSVVRCKNIFGHNRVTIITQEFHNRRALFISQYYHMEAVGFEAKDADSFWVVKVQVREYLARARAVLDLYVLKTAPKFPA